MNACPSRLLFICSALALGALISLDTNAQSTAPDRPASSSVTVGDNRTDRPNEDVTIRDNRTDRPNQKPEVTPRPESQSFWTTLPGILTGVAAVIGAIAGLVVAFRRRDQ
jgi:hypothetical protein